MRYFYTSPFISNWHVLYQRFKRGTACVQTAVVPAPLRSWCNLVPDWLQLITGRLHLEGRSASGMTTEGCQWSVSCPSWRSVLPIPVHSSDISDIGSNSKPSVVLRPILLLVSIIDKRGLAFDTVVRQWTFINGRKFYIRHCCLSSVADFRLR